MQKQNSIIMSFDILYNRQFIKVDDKRVIPFVLIGSNNLYEAGSNNKRVREWSNIFTYNDGKRVIVENDTLLANIDKYRERTMERCAEQVKEYKDDSWAYDDKRWGYHVGVAMYGKHTSTTTFSAYRSFFKNGIKEAMTIEQLFGVGVRISIRVSPYYDEKEFQADNIMVLPTIVFKTTQELVDTVAEYEAYYKDVKSATLWLSASGMDNYLERKRYQRKRDKVKERVTVNEYYVIKHIENDTYFTKGLKYGYRYSYHAISGKAFHSEAKAKAFHKRMRNKELFAVTKIEDTRTFSI